MDIVLTYSKVVHEVLRLSGSETTDFERVTNGIINASCHSHITADVNVRFSHTNIRHQARGDLWNDILHVSLERTTQMIFPKKSIINFIPFLNEEHYRNIYNNLIPKLFFFV